VLNVEDSDGTLIIARGDITGGTAFARDHARALGKPLLILDVSVTGTADAARTAREWIERCQIETLNVAGPRASQDPAIYADAYAVLSALLRPQV
jgi:hypothetical protein